VRLVHKILLTLLLVGVAGPLLAAGSYSAFTATTQNPDNVLATGTVVLGDNDANSFMYDVTDAKAGQVVERCIRVSYTGTLPADVKLYTGSTIGTLGPYVDLEITPGSQSGGTFRDCTGFTAETSGAIFTGTLAGFASTHSSWTNGLADTPEGETAWRNPKDVVYRFRLTVRDEAGASGKSTGTHAFTWEAQQQ